MPAPTPPAIVFGAEITGLAVVRALGRNGVPVYVAGDRTALVSRSRWYSPAPGQAIEETSDGERVADYLRTLPFPRAVLFPCADQWATALASLPPAVTDSYPAPVAPARVMRILVDKARFAAAAGEFDVPTPRTVRAASAEDLDALEAADLTALFFKPTDSQLFARRFGVKAMRARGRAEAVEILDRVADAGLEVLLQEYIPGPPTDHVFLDGYVDRGGVMRGCLARRRLRMNPPEFGNSTMSETIPLGEAARALESLRRLLEGIGYTGLFDAEFKYDYRDDTFKILEVNARPWWQLEIAAASGLDLCMMAYRDALGEPLETASGYRLGRTWVHPLPDLRAWWSGRKVGRPAGSIPPRAFFGGANAIFSLDDPMPLADALGSHLRESARGWASRARERLGRPASRVEPAPGSAETPPPAGAPAPPAPERPRARRFRSRTRDDSRTASG
jgi:predicted ATP-grasp superfamily ATP-dependent carboligase